MIAVGIIAFEEEEYIGYLLKNWYPYAGVIIVAEGAWQSAAKSFGYDKSKDRTVKIVKNFPDPDKKIKLVHVSTKNQITQLNYCYQLALKYKPDWYVMSGADEFYHESELETLESDLGKLGKNSIAFNIPMKLMWNDFYHFEKQRARRFIKCSNLNRVHDLSRFKTKSGKVVMPEKIMFPTMYHPSYVRSNIDRFRAKSVFRRVDSSSGDMKHYEDGGIIYRGTCTKDQWLQRFIGSWCMANDQLPAVLREHPNAKRKWNHQTGTIKI